MRSIKNWTGLNQAVYITITFLLKVYNSLKHHMTHFSYIVLSSLWFKYVKSNYHCRALVFILVEGQQFHLFPWTKLLTVFWLPLHIQCRHEWYQYSHPSFSGKEKYHVSQNLPKIEIGHTFSNTSWETINGKQDLLVSLDKSLTLGGGGSAMLCLYNRCWMRSALCELTVHLKKIPFAYDKNANDNVCKYAKGKQWKVLFLSLLFL